MARNKNRRNPWNRSQEDDDHQPHPQRDALCRSTTSNSSIHHKPHNYRRNNSFATSRFNLLATSAKSRNPFHPQNPPWNISGHDSSKYNHLNFRPQTQPQTCCHLCQWKCQELKKHLIQTLEQALTQIEQWYGSSEDEMDWQPEEVIEMRACSCGYDELSTPLLFPRPVMSSALNDNHVAAGNVMRESSRERGDGSLHRENTVSYTYAGGCGLSEAANTFIHPTSLHSPSNSERQKCPLDAEIC